MKFHPMKINGLYCLSNMLISNPYNAWSKNQSNSSVAAWLRINNHQSLKLKTKNPGLRGIHSDTVHNCELYISQKILGIQYARHDFSHFGLFPSQLAGSNCWLMAPNILLRGGTNGWRAVLQDMQRYEVSSSRKTTHWASNLKSHCQHYHASDLSFH